MIFLVERIAHQVCHHTYIGLSQHVYMERPNLMNHHQIMRAVGYVRRWPSGCAHRIHLVLLNFLSQKDLASLAPVNVHLLCQ